MTYCLFKGGPADGLAIPTADHYCTRRIVIYRVEGEPNKGLSQPAVYLRDPTDQGTRSVVGMDGVTREFSTLGYVFERFVPRELAERIERVRMTESDAEVADGGSL